MQSLYYLKYCTNLKKLGNRKNNLERFNNKEIPAPGPGDYYFNEQGLMVFTEKYHQKRGYCCKSGCKHCPYGFKKNK
jgi:hypothetical protein